MNDEEFGSLNLLQNEGLSNWDFLQNSFSPEIWSPIFNLGKFWKSEKHTLESCRMHWNLMNDEEFFP